MDFSDTPQFTSLSRTLGISGRMPAKTVKQEINFQLVNFFNRFIIGVKK